MEKYIALLDETIPKEVSVPSGVAKNINNDGEKTGDFGVMVIREDVMKFVTSLNFVNRQLNLPGVKASPVMAIEAIKEAFATNLTGKLDDNVNIAEAIEKDFPLKIDCLDVTPEKIRLMDNDTFDMFKDRILETSKAMTRLANSRNWYKLEVPDEVAKELRSGGYNIPEYRFVDAKNWNK